MLFLNHLDLNGYPKSFLTFPQLLRLYFPRSSLLSLLVIILILYRNTFLLDKTRSNSAKKVNFYGIIKSFDTNTTIEYWFYKNRKREDTMKTNNSNQQLQQKKQNQTVKKE